MSREPEIGHPLVSFAREATTYAIRLGTGGIRLSQALTRQAVAGGEVAVRSIVRKVVAYVLDEVDIDELVDRVDIDAVIARLDLDQIAARLDVNAVAARVDLDAIVSRIDLGALTQEVLAEVDIPSLVRESGTSLAAESVEAIRVRSVQADRAVARLVDRILFRTAERDVDLSASPS